MQEGIDKFFEAAQAATAAMEEAAPLLEEATQLAKEITPLLQVGYFGLCEVLHEVLLCSVQCVRLWERADIRSSMRCGPGKACCASLGDGWLRCCAV